ncbi:MAG TPA: cytochrome c oxidase subunit II [Chloroflexia bacterium]|nr:cytochrome c oxidase subunit II [Chloroflexia bacterium]
MPDPQSPLAQASIDLFNGALLISTLIVLGVGGLLAYMMVRYRARSGAGEPTPDFGNHKLEIAWTIAPAILLTVIAVFTFPALRAQEVDTSKAAGGGTPDLIVIGHQWWWEIRYPQANVVTANELHLPTGRQLLVQLEGADVIHSLWIPQLAPKLDNVPGHTNWMWLRADRAGTYQGACAEYCGTQHAWMLIRAVAQAPADFDAWLRQQGAPAAAVPAGAAAQHGAQIFAQRTCISCHAIAGTAARAVVGPNLTHFASRQILAAGVLENNAANVTRWLRNPQSVKPGNLMPNVRLSDDELRDLTAYMESLR